jgi:hypothetical protein
LGQATSLVALFRYEEILVFFFIPSILLGRRAIVKCAVAFHGLFYAKTAIFA